ncbi:MAG TPA: S8 family serine peptidase, partial [Acidobacteriota bacterium]|nr:S8 family serine peptidase [Acidobacteriota bacterium]
MKRILLLTALLSCFISLVFADDSHDSKEIMIQLKPGVSINTINARYGTTTEDVLLRGTVYRVEVSEADKLDSTIAAMKKDPDILQVDFNYFGEAPEAFRRTLAVIDTSPTQSRYHDQDAYKRVRAQQAQTLSTGAGVVVAVIDTGVDYRHPALADHILRDSKNRVVGYDFVQNDRDPMDSTNGLDDDHDGLIDEGAGHGTHVSGIIRLVAPGAKIMPLRVLNSDGVGTSDAVARAIEYAVEYREETKVPMVINLSLGFPTQSFVVQDAIGEAAEEGIPVVASAGNDHSAPHYPAAYSGVISVTAIGPNGVKADFSNFGKGQIELSAPGIGIYSTFLKGGYAWWDGTSMSAPFVSAEAALAMSMMRVHKA